jgi:hypothetical protein
MSVVIENSDLERLLALAKETPKKGPAVSQYKSELIFRSAQGTYTIPIRTSREDSKEVHVQEAIQALMERLQELQQAGDTSGLEVAVSSQDAELEAYAHQIILNYLGVSPSEIQSAAEKTPNARKDWSEFARLITEDVTAPPLSDYAVSRESLYEDHL